MISVFNAMYFYKFLLYHVLFFLLGPLTVPFVWLFDTMSLNFNMALLGWSLGVFLQYLTYVCIVTMDLMLLHFRSEFVTQD